MSHYLKCTYCGGHHFAVIRGESGEIKKFECSECGGSGVEADPIG